MKGLTASIYRDDYRCTLNKFNNVNRVTIVDPEIDEVSTASETAPAVRIVRRIINGSPYIHAEPMEKGFYMFGGSYISSSDGRVNALNQYPIPLHDRQE
jgi:hypothetical protein